MKNRNYFICGILLLLVLFSGCTKDVDTVTFLAKVESLNGGTKMEINGNHYMCWKEGDKVNINGAEYSIVKVADGYQITAVSSSSYTAIYPNEHIATATGGNIIFSIPKIEHNFKSGFPVKSPVVAYCPAGGTELTFRNAGAVLGIQIKSTFGTPVNLKSITITSGTNITGNAIIDDATGTTPKIEITANGGKSKQYIIDPVDAEIDGTPKTFYLPVPPTQQGNKFTIEIDFSVSSVKYHFKKETKTVIGEVGRNYFIEFPLTLKSEDIQAGYITLQGDLYGNGNTEPYKIYTQADLDLVKSKINAGTPYYNGSTSSERYTSYELAKFEQLGNLTFSGGIGTDANPFKGEYNGNNNSLTLEGQNGGIFNILGQNAYIYNIFVKCNSLKSSENNIGSVANEIKEGNVKIYNCHYSGRINLSISAEKCVGGICGKIGNYAGVEISRCKYIRTRGMQNVQDNVNDKFGGICGAYEGTGNSNKLTIKDCEVNAKLYSTGTCGYILGYAYGTEESVNIINPTVFGSAEGDESPDVNINIGAYGNN